MWKALGFIRHKDNGDIKQFYDSDENGYCIGLTFDGKEPNTWVSAKMWEELDFWGSVEEAECKQEESYLSPQNEFEKELINACTNLASTLIKKNRDYGDSFRKLYDEYGDNSTAWRLTDKLNRYKTLNKQDNLVKDESKDDTLQDIAGYSILTLVTKQLSRGDL